MSETDRDEFNLREAFELARETIKTLFALNGGAAIAILAFYGQALNAADKMTDGAREALTSSLQHFGSGALAASVTFLVAYLTQFHWGAAYKNDRVQTRGHRLAQIFHLIAMGCTIASMALFVWGVFDVRRAIQAKPLPHQPTPTALKVRSKEGPA